MKTTEQQKQHSQYPMASKPGDQSILLSPAL